jgi:hypothetical protein
MFGLKTEVGRFQLTRSWSLTKDYCGLFYFGFHIASTLAIAPPEIANPTFLYSLEKICLVK